MQTVVGLDIGHSAVKIVVSSGGGRAKRFIFPSVVAPAINISDETEARRAALETVRVDGKLLFIGETAAAQGRNANVTGLNADWTESSEHSALFLGALEKLRIAGVEDLDTSLILVGLPAKQYANERISLRDTLKKHFASAEIKVLSQPVGPYNALMFTEEGWESPSQSITEESWGVIEVGHFTTDFALIDRGRWIEEMHDSSHGVRIAAESLSRSLAERGIPISSLEAIEALKTKFIRNFDKRLDISHDVEKATDVLVSGIVDKAMALLGGRARTLDGVIIAGGGAPLVFDAIKAKWPHAMLPDEPRYAVADGFCRFGRAILNDRSLRS